MRFDKSKLMWHGNEEVLYAGERGEVEEAIASLRQQDRRQWARSRISEVEKNWDGCKAYGVIGTDTYMLFCTRNMMLIYGDETRRRRALDVMRGKASVMTLPYATSITSNVDNV